MEEKIVKKIENLLALANNNPNENEALSAALKAQELMAKYNIALEQLDHEEETREIIEIIYRQTDKHEMRKWKWGLANIVAKNFRCKTYAVNHMDVVFYGYKEDAQIALQVFKYLYENGNKMALKYYYQVKKIGGNTKGVMNTYLIGFKTGVESVLAKQCTALMIITPKEVTDSFDEMVKNEGFGTMQNRISILGHNNKAYSDGKIDGKNIASARALETAV